MLSCLPPSTTIHTEQGNLIVYDTKQNRNYGKIAVAMKKFPSQNLKELAYTEDLRICWGELRELYKSIAKLFLLKSFNWDISDYEQLNVNQRKLHNLIDSIAERYLSLYKLIKYTFPKIKKRLISCPSTPENLFLSIVEDEVNDKFERLIRQDYIEVNIPELEKCLKRLKIINDKLAKSSVSVKELNRYKKLIPKGINNKSKAQIACVLEKITSIEDSKVKFLGANYNAATDYFIDSILVLCNAKNKNRTMFIKSIIWENGIPRYMSTN